MPDQPIAESERSAFPRLLRALRERRGLNQARLARLVALSPSMLNMLESGDRRPTRDQIVRLVAALDLPAADADDLLAAGGHLPAAYDAVPPTDPDVLLLVRTLADAALSDAERLRLRLIVRLACATWQPEAFDLAPYALDGAHE